MSCTPRSRIQNFSHPKRLKIKMPRNYKTRPKRNWKSLNLWKGQWVEGAASERSLKNVRNLVCLLVPKRYRRITRINLCPSKMMARLSRRKAFASRTRKSEYLSLSQISFRGKKTLTSLMSRMRFRQLRKFYQRQKLRAPSSNTSTNQIMLQSSAAPRNP